MLITQLVQFVQWGVVEQYNSIFAMTWHAVHNVQFAGIQNVDGHVFTPTLVELPKDLLSFHARSRRQAVQCVLGRKHVFR